MKSTPCDKFDYSSDDYNSCIKDIVYEQAQDEWIMLDPRFPNLKGITPKRIDEFLANAEKEGMRDYFEDYLQHVMVYDRDDIVSMCYDLGKQIEKKYPGKLHSPHSIFVTTPRGGHEVLSIFAYTNDLKKEQIPSHIRYLKEFEKEILIKDCPSKLSKGTAKFLGIGRAEEEKEDIEKMCKYLEKEECPIMPDIWLNTTTTYYSNKIETVFIIDDIIASGEQMLQAVDKLQRFFNQKVEIIPIVLVKRKEFIRILKENSVLEKTLYNTETVGKTEWDEAREFVEQQNREFMTPGIEEFMSPNPELIEDYDKLITVRFPWGSPDGESDKILTTLYESRRGLERIERKQRRCAIEPDKCELK